MVRTILAGLGTAFVTFVVTAIVLTVLDIYLAGHNLPRPMQQRLTAQMNVGDAVALGVSAAVGAIVMIRQARGR